MSDFKNIVEFFRLNRRYEESEKKYSNDVIALTTLETKEKYELDTQKFNTLKLLRDIFNLFMPTEIFISNNASVKEFYVKTNTGTYFNIVTEQVDVNVTSADVYPVPLEDFPFEQYFYDSSKNSVVIADILLKNIQVFPESIRYDPNSELLENFSQQETLGYSYSTHQTWVYDFVSFFIPNNDAEDHPFEKHVSDSDVTVTQTRVTELISIIPLIRESIGKYYVSYNIYKKDDGKIIPFYLNGNNFSDGNAPVVSLKFNSLGAFMAYLNDTIFSQTDNFTFGKRPAFIDQYKEIVILPLIRNLESRSTFSYYDALQALYYLPESLFYMLPEGFLWKFFDKAIANDSFSNKPYSKEEDIFLKILQALVSTEENAVKFIERLSKKVSEQNPQMLLEFFNDRIHGDNFLEFAGIVNKAWRKTRFVDYSSETNPEFASTDGPTLLPYHSEKLAGFFFSNVSASFEDGPKNKKERFLRFKFETGKTRKVSSNLPDGTPVDVDEQIIKEVWYHPFYPVKIKNTGEENKDQETAIQLDAIVPAFMLFANANQQFWHNVIKSGEYALDLAVIAGSSGTLSGIAAGEIIGTLAVARGVGAVAGITSSVANIVLKLANAEDSFLGQAFCEYLFWIEMLSLGGELTIAIRNGLKRSAVRLVEKEEDLVRLEKQLDEAVIEENGAKRKLSKNEKDEIVKEFNERRNFKIDNFIERNMANGKTIGSISKEVIIRELHNITDAATEISRALKKGKIKLVKLDEKEFLNAIKMPGEKMEDIEDVLASQIEDVIYIRNDRPLDKAFGEIVHEGQHALDELKDIAELREETKLIVHDKISMRNYVDKMTDGQVIELRARIVEREFQQVAKQKLDFSSVAEMISFIFKIYK